MMAGQFTKDGGNELAIDMTNSGCHAIFFLSYHESLFTVQVSPSFVVSLQGPNQRRLYKDLMYDYSPLERPVGDESQTVTVELGLSLMQIMDLVRKF